MPTNVLSEAAVTALLSRPMAVRVFEEIDSTNAEAKRVTTAGNRADTLFLANRQTAGRGRLGRSFWSPEQGLYMTLALYGVREWSDAVLLTTMTSAAVVDAIEALTPLKPQIKWVNDIYLDGRKAGGILTESMTDPTSGDLVGVVIGIGLNVGTADFPPELAEIATSLAIAPVTREALAAAIVDRVYGYLDELPKRTFLASYRAHSLVLGRSIRLFGTGEDTTATALSIDEDGGLVVRMTDGTERHIHSGEISVRIGE
ncbi:MAG: biotin--[Clostridia bacterium]|nr:biotin--[acetyl-CoA-carboxylase] ligase [Clostridia bacterium]